MSTYLAGRSQPEITQRNGQTVLARPWRFFGFGYTLRVPEGYVTDLASVPRLFWPLISAWDLSFAAPILHDFLYEYGGRPPAGAAYPANVGFSRRETDALFLHLMAEEGVAAWRRWIAWAAVRLFGRGRW